MVKSTTLNKVQLFYQAKEYPNLLLVCEGLSFETTNLFFFFNGGGTGIWSTGLMPACSPVHELSLWFRWTVKLAAVGETVYEPPQASHLHRNGEYLYFLI